LPISAIDGWFGFFSRPSGMRVIFIVAIFIAGWFIVRRKPADIFQNYLLALMVFATSMADQYLAIPIVACAIYWKRWPTWLYMFVATALVQRSMYEGGALGTIKPWWFSMIGGARQLHHYHAIIWLAILLILVLRRDRKSGMAEAAR
jgi:hypothetical protein